MAAYRRVYDSRHLQASQSSDVCVRVCFCHGMSWRAVYLTYWPQFPRHDQIAARFVSIVDARPSRREQALVVPSATEIMPKHCPPSPYHSCLPQLLYLNSWPTFSPYLYNRVWSELTCCNSLSHSRLACSRLSAHIQPSVNNPDTNGAANSVVVSIYNGHELS